MTNPATVSITRGDRQRIPSSDESEWIELTDPTTGEPLDLTDRSVSFAMTTEAVDGLRVSLTNEPVVHEDPTTGKVAITLAPGDTAVPINGARTALYGQFSVSGGENDPTTASPSVKITVSQSRADIEQNAELLASFSFSAMAHDGVVDAEGTRLANLSDPVNPQDAVNQRTLESVAGDVDTSSLAPIDGGGSTELTNYADIGSDEFSASGKPWHDITQYGAVGDGSTDDTDAIQSAIDAAAAENDVSVVYYPNPSASYHITNTLTVPSNVYHVGDGRSTITASGLGTGPFYQNLATDAPNNVLFEGLHMDGEGAWDNTSSYDTGQKHIFIQYGRDLTIRNNRFENSDATSLGCDAVMRDSYLFNTILNAGTDGQTTGSNGIGIGLAKNQEGGFGGRVPTWVVGNFVRDTAMHAITFESIGGLSEWLFAVNNVCHKCHTGISFEDCYDGFSANNMVRKASAQGYLFNTFEHSVGTEGPTRVTSIGDHSISAPAPQNGDFNVGADATDVSIISPKYINGMTDNGTRTTINGVGTNSGDPSSTGQWNGNGKEGVQVFDTQNSAKYWYVNDSWV